MGCWLGVIILISYLNCQKGKLEYRVISKCKCNAQTDIPLKNVHIIEYLHRLHVLKMSHEVIHEKTFLNTFIHSYPIIRNNKKLVAPKIPHEFARKCIKYI